MSLEGVTKGIKDEKQSMGKEDVVALNRWGKI